MPPRKTSGDVRAASSQLKTADQTARVAKDSRAKTVADEIVVPMRGKEFRLGHSPSLMTLMEWGAASGGESLVAAFHVLEALVHEDDWEDFKRHCRDKQVEVDEYSTFINAATEALSGRPTEAPSGS